MDIFKLLSICVIAAILSLVVKESKKEYGMILSIICGIVIFTVIIDDIDIIIKKISDITTSFNLPYNALKTVFKAIAISILSEISSALCKDMGENAIAVKTELVGKVSLIILGLPIVFELLNIVVSLLNT